MIEELKPCPFCGGEVQHIKGWDELDNYVKCGKCGVRTKAVNTKQGAIKDWNRRVADEQN